MFIRGLMGPFGSGKSSGCIWEIVQRGLAQKAGRDGIKRTRWAVIRNSYPQLRDTTIKTVHQWFPPNIFGEYKSTDHSYLIKEFEKCEIEILFRALDRPDHISNLLSLELTGAWVNEAREVPWTIIEALQGRVGRFPAVRDGGPSWHGIIMDTNPPDADSKWYRFFEERKNPPAFAQIFKQPSGLSREAENLKNLVGGQEYYRKLAIGKEPEWVKVYIHGEYGYVIDGRPVFPQYSDAMHCVECQTIEDAPVYRGWDFGLTPACCFCQLTPNGQFIIVDELVSEDMGVDQFSDEVLAHSSLHFPNTEFVDVGDPAGMQRSQTDEKTCFQILHAKKVYIEPGLQTLAIRLESLRKPMTTLRNGVPGFAVHPRCRVTRKGLQGAYAYRRLQTSAERFSDKPDKNMYSHIMDAAQYVATIIFGGGLTMRKDDEDDGSFDDGYSSRSDVTGY